MDPGRDGEMRALLRESVATRAVDPARAERVRAAVHAEWRAHHAPRMVPWRLWTGLAATAAAVAAVVVFLPGDRPGSPAHDAPRDDAAVATVGFVTGAMQGLSAGASAATALRAGDVVRDGAVVSTGGTTHGTVVFDDGVEVRLNGLTTLAFRGPRRLELRRGDIYVDTNPRRGPGVPRPIEIAIAGSVIRDVGTRFLVHGGRTVGVRVRVRDGRVQVDHGGGVYEAGAGEHVNVTANGRVSVARGPTFGPDWDWIVRAVPAQPVDGRTLAEFLAWVEREGGRTVRFVDAAVGREAGATRVYGAIDGLTVEEALEVVLPSCGLAHRIEGGVITILAAEEPRGRR